MKENYEFVAIFNYEKDGINISFPDLPGVFSSASTTKEAIKNANEVLGLVLYDMENDQKHIPEPTSLENIKCEKNEKTVLVNVWMPLIRNELDEQTVKKTLTIPQKNI